MRRVVLTLPCLALLFACGPQSGRPSGPSDESQVDIGCFQEFGDDVGGELAQAQLVEEEELTGCLGDSQRDPADAFRFRVPDDERRDALYQFEIEPGDDLGLCVTLVDPMEKELKRECSREAGQPLKLWAVVATSRELRLRLEPTLALASTQPYTIRSSYEIIDDTDEPNEYLEDATALTLGEAHETYFLASAGAAPEELDIYRVDLAKTGGLLFQIANAPAGVTLSVELLDDQGKKLQRIVAKGKGADMDESFTINKGGTYYLRLKNALGSFVPAKAGSDEVPEYVRSKYSIRVSFE